MLSTIRGLFAFPPAPHQHEPTEQPMPQGDPPVYFTIDDINASDELRAAADAGLILPWSVAADGTQWFRTAPMIRGIE